MFFFNKKVVYIFFTTFACKMKPIIIEDNIFGFEPCEEDGSVLLAEETPWRGFADELQELHYLNNKEAREVLIMKGNKLLPVSRRFVEGNFYIKMSMKRYLTQLSQASLQKLNK